MKTNPLYHIINLANKLPSIPTFKSDKTSHVALFKLKCPKSDSVLSLSHHQITIHEQYNDKIGVISQYHYTAKYTFESDNLTARVYFNADDKVVHITSLSGDRQFNAGIEFKKYLQETAIQYTQDHIAILRQALKVEAVAADEYFKTTIKSLEDLSANFDENADKWCEEAKKLDEFFKARYKLVGMEKYRGSITLINKLASDVKQRELPKFNRSLSSCSITSQNSETAEVENEVINETHESDQFFEKTIREAIILMNQYDESNHTSLLKKSIEQQVLAEVSSLQFSPKDLSSIQQMIGLKNRHAEARYKVIEEAILSSNLSTGDDQVLLKEIEKKTSGLLSIEECENPPQSIANLFKMSLGQLNAVGCKFLLDKYPSLGYMMIQDLTVAQYIFSRSLPDSKRAADPGKLEKCFNIVLDALGEECLQVRAAPNNWKSISSGIISNTTNVLYQPLSRWLTKDKRTRQRIQNSILRDSVERCCREHCEKHLQEVMRIEDTEINQLVTAARKLKKGTQSFLSTLRELVLQRYIRNNLRLWGLGQDNRIAEISTRAYTQVKNNQTGFDFKAFLEKEGFVSSMNLFFSHKLSSMALIYEKEGSFDRDLKDTIEEVSRPCSAQPSQ